MRLPPVEMLDIMKEALGDSVQSVRFTKNLKNHPVCLSTEGGLSLEMEKTLNKMPGTEAEGVKAQTVLEINANHAIGQKLEQLFESDKEKLAIYAKVLYAQARLIGGMSVDNPTELSSMICDLLI